MLLGLHQYVTLHLGLFGFLVSFNGLWTKFSICTLCNLNHIITVMHSTINMAYFIKAIKIVVTLYQKAFTREKAAFWFAPLLMT